MNDSNSQLSLRVKELEQQLSQRTLELQSAQEQIKKEIAAQQKLASQLRQSQKMEAVGQLAAGVAHDFNNILTVVQGNATLLLAIKPPASPECRPLENICGASERAAKLIRQLLTFCRKQVVELRPTNLRNTLATASEMLPRVLTANLQIHAHAPEGLPLVSADGPMMESLLLNMASNARDAMPDGGTLTITAQAVTVGAAEVAQNPQAREGSFVRLSVSDTGCGIPPEVLPRIFEPFFTTKPVGEGPGLGLATVHGIVQQHQGWVEVQTKVNEGTTFHIFLPALAVSQLPQPKPPAAPAKIMRERILVVDDEPDLRDLVTQVLETGGYQVISAGSGAEALELWANRGGEVHLLLTDIVMPDGLTGHMLAARLRSEDPRLRVLYTSGYTAGTPGSELACVDERNFLPKPYRPATLLRVVRECLDHPGAPVQPTQKAA